MKKIVYIFIFISFLVKAGNPPSIIFKENKGQWPEKVLFGAEYLNTKYFLTKTGFRICVYGEAPKHIHEINPNLSRPDNIGAAFKNRKGHVYEVDFIGANYSSVEESGEQSEYYNYFLGNNKKQWAGNVKAFEKIKYNDFYPNTNLIVYSSGSNLKYDFELNPGSSSEKIKMNYKYTDGISIKNNKLIIKTAVGEVKEYEPYAYQVVNGKKKEVMCKYILYNDFTVGFDFPEGYDKSQKLIIDPTVIVCSYSGSSVWSNCEGASYDEYGNIFVLGYSTSGYPTDTMVFQDTNNGNYNIVLSKYNPTGSIKYFSTYLGGNGMEIPQNVIINKIGIFIYSQTTSTNFPVTVNAFDTTFGGSADLTMSRLNLSGSSLLGSTYIGGYGNDGSNDIANGVFAWYGSDASMIGHFVMDDNGNSYCISATTSSNFPVSSSAFQTSKKGITDAVVFKLDSTLSTLLWSTYLGGTNSENGMGIRHDGVGGAYVTGTTYSNNFPTTAGVIQATDLGSIDMYLAHINNSGSALVASTYLGTAANDWGYFIDIDQNNDVFLCGYMDNPPSLVSTPGVYSSSLGKNTIYKVNSSLSTLTYKTKFGTSLPTPGNNIVYSAFEVDSCQNIYIAGSVTNSYMPVSIDALQTKVKGLSDMYFAVFRNNMSSLGYGTYFGGRKGEHVDGGISSFTKRGTLYQGICNQSDLPVTPNAYSTVDSTFISDTTWYNDGFVKIDMQTFVNANSSYGANITGCPPFTPTFVSTTNTGSSYWNLGNGTTSTSNSVSTTYTGLGNYNVLLVVTDTTTCNRYDSIKSILSVINPTSFDIGDDVPTCLGVKALVRSNISAITYSWSTGQTTPNIYAYPGTYTLTINNGGCYSSDEVNVVPYELKLSERFPNVVTPNGDNINDLVDFTKYNFDEVEFILYDRWGKERFKTMDRFEKWSPDLNDGTYFYVVNYKSSCTGKHASDKGFISIFK